MPTLEFNSTYTYFGPDYPTPLICRSIFVVIIAECLKECKGRSAQLGGASS